MSSLIFGVAKDIITPAIPTTMIGFSTVFGVPFEAIHDDLYVRILLLQDEKQSVLLMSMDLLFHDDSLPEALREYIAERYEIPRDNFLLTYTHTHYGPAVKGYDFNFYTPEYESFLLERAKSCIDRAFSNRREGTMAYTRVEGDWNVSRRLYEDGEMQFKPNLDGLRDKYMYLLKICDGKGRLRALLTNYACHPSNFDQYNTLSAEYPGRLCQLIEAANYGCTALFFQGSGADTKLKIGAKSSSFHPATADDIAEVAAGMAARVQNALISQEWRPLKAELGAVMFKIPAPLEVLPYEFFVEEWKRFGGESVRFDKSMAGSKSSMGTNDRAFRLANAEYLKENYENLPEELLLNCGIVRLSADMYIFTMAGEPSYAVKQVLEQLLGHEQMLFFGYNDAIAYIPTDAMLEEGGYEAGESAVPEYRLKGPFEKGIDVLFLKYFKENLEKLDKKQ